MLRRLIGGRGKEGIPFSASSAGRQNQFLSVFVYFACYFIGLRSSRHCTERHFQNFIFSVGSRTILRFPSITGFGATFLATFQMQERPHLRIAPQDDVSAASAVASVGAAFLHKFFAVEMPKARPSLAGARMKFDVVNKIG